jgi:adenine deaminase
MISVPQRKELIKAILNHEELDLLIENVQVVDVYTGRITPGILGIKDGRIVHPDAKGYSAKVTFDGRGCYAMPGFMDSHVHLDSTLLTPENLAEMIVPHGTTVMLADPMEIANVAGIEGLKALLLAADEVPYHILLEVCSRVPTAPGLETTGGELRLPEVAEILSWENSISLGELDPSKVLGMLDEYLGKVEAAHALNKIANGHAAGLSGDQLVAYANGGLADDHECVDYEDAVARLKLGLAVLVREGSTERNLELILGKAMQEGLNTRHFMFCTDDKHPDDIEAEGHIDYMVNKAIALGVPPVEAIQMASLNTAQHFRMEERYGSLTPGRWADVVLSESLEKIVPVDVFVRGEHVASQGKLTQPIFQIHYPEWIRHTVKLTNGRKADDFILKAKGEQADVHVIELYPDQIINQPGKATLPVVNGAVQTDPARDLLKLAVVERYGKNGNIGVTYVQGFGMQNGAIASSVSHDHHNIVVTGTNDADMAACAAAIEDMQGGLAVAANGKVLGRLPLPIGGLLSEKPAAEVIKILEEMTAVYHELGGTLPAPFMTISFISLPTVPELGLTDMGLVDVREHKLISPFC